MEEDKLNKAIDLLKSEIEIYDQYYCLATSQALKIVLNELDRLQKENEELSYIISEIEQYTLDEQINEESINYNEFIEVQNMAFDRVYNKLQELLNKGE